MNHTTRRTCVLSATLSIVFGTLPAAIADQSLVVYPPVDVSSAIAVAPVSGAELEQLYRNIREDIRTEIRTEIRREMGRLGASLAASTPYSPTLDLTPLEPARNDAQRREDARVEQAEVEELAKQVQRERIEREQAQGLTAQRGEEAAGSPVTKARNPSPISRTIRTGSRPGDATCLDLPARRLGYGSIDRSDWREWMDSVRFSIGDDALSVSVGKNGRRALRQRYVPSNTGTPRVVMGANLPAARTYRLTQSIMFERGWDWGGKDRQSGKIGFGLSGGTSPTGGSIDPAGYSARLIWRGNQGGSPRLAVYSYAADRPGIYGEEIPITGFTPPIGRWFDVTMEVTTNSGTGTNDGALRIWTNGQLRLKRDNIAWQTAGRPPVVDNLYYSSFYGGNSSDWSPDRVTYARVRDVCWAPLVNGRSGIDPYKGQLKAPLPSQPSS